MFAVLTDYGYTVVELLDDADLDVGDTVKGDLDDHGGVTLVHAETGQRFEGYVQAIQATQLNAVSLIR